MAELQYCFAGLEDLELLTEWNHQLIEDEGSNNSMSVPALRERMKGWLESGEYRAVLFRREDRIVAYALFIERDEELYLRQFFVSREHRRCGHGRGAMDLLRSKIWPRDKSLTVDVLTRNTGAYTFWRECGYQADYIHMRQNGGLEPTGVDPAAEPCGPKD